MRLVDIGGREVGQGRPAFIIAELSANHLQRFDLALDTVRAAKEAGADAIKLQAYTPDTITIDCDKEYFQIKQGTLWDGKTLYQLYQEAYTPWEWHPELRELARKLGLICFSSPFDSTAVDFLETMDVPAYKVASFEITDIPLIEYIAAKHKPVIISTGIAEIDEIHEALAACKRMGNEQLVLLKCTSAYPAPLQETDLKALADLQSRFETVVGVSDHTVGSSVALAAVALGAKVVEKHFILDRKLGGPDAAFSMQPDEFGQMVKGIREVERALGEASYRLSPQARKNRCFARSLFVVADIKAGEKFSANNVRSIRPSYGLAPKHLSEIIGKKALRDIERGTPLSWDLIDRKTD